MDEEKTGIERIKENSEEGKPKLEGKLGDKYYSDRSHRKNKGCLTLVAIYSPLVVGAYEAISYFLS